MKKKVFAFLGVSVLVLFPFSAFAQELTIKNVSMQPNDLTAVQSVCLDNNQDTCALLKIKTDNLEGVQFPEQNQYIKSYYSDGIYYVYLPALCTKLDIQHKDYLKIQLDMKDFGFKRLHKGKTYLVILEAPKIKDLESSLVIKVEPESSTLYFDEQEYSSNSNGTYKIPISPGNHTYKVVFPDYLSENGTIQIGKLEAKTLTVVLKPILHEIDVKSNVDDASVYVDNIYYGRVGNLKLPQGNHNIRVQAEGYVDSENDVQINSATGSLSYNLELNRKVIDVHPTPVRIFSTASNVYKDNKKIKEWKNGAIINIMPGKYLIEDDAGHKQKIKVNSEPMDVYLDKESSQLNGEMSGNSYSQRLTDSRNSWNTVREQRHALFNVTQTQQTTSSYPHQTTNSKNSKNLIREQRRTSSNTNRTRQSVPSYLQKRVNGNSSSSKRILLPERTYNGGGLGKER